MLFWLCWDDCWGMDELPGYGGWTDEIMDEAAGIIDYSSIYPCCCIVFFVYFLCQNIFYVFKFKL